jgi:hypothetical protein
VRNKIQGWTLDKSTLLPLPYSVIADIDLNFGYYSDSIGLFTLYYNTEKDSIKISNLGYKNVYTSISDLKKNPKIFLESVHNHINEIDVTSIIKRAAPIEVGYFSSGSTLIMGTIYPLNIHAIYIPFPDGVQNALIKSVNINYLPGKMNKPLRIRILTINPDGTPGEDLINQSIIFTVPQKKQRKVAIVDISKFNIQMPRLGLFLVLEWIIDTTPVELRKEPGIVGPYLGIINKPEYSPSPWINGYNSTKWKEIVSDKIPAVGFTVVNVFN